MLGVLFNARWFCFLTAAETAEEVKTATDSFNATIQSGAKVLR
jgi:hypothetical protein